jgi:diguanylate cyclase (GGDEF)-like protein
MAVDLYATLVDALEQGIIVVDAIGTIEVWNAWMARVSGLETEQAVGRRLVDIVPELGEGRAARAVRRALDRGTSSLLSYALNPGRLPFYQVGGGEGSGSIKAFQQSIVVRPVENKNGGRRCMIQIRDVSRVVQMEDHVRQLSRVIDDQRVEIEAQQAEVERKSSFDAVTGLSNRAHLRDELTAILGAAEVGRGALIFFDLNQFKAINESFGQELGDQILRSVANRLSEIAPAGSHLARVGSDEFAIAMVGASKEGAVHVAKQIAEALSRPHELDGREVFLAASGGIACYPADGDQADILIRSCERALRRARNLGPHHYELYQRSVDDPSSDLVSLTGSLHRAVERQEFRLVYQPILDVKTGRLAGAEALIRWQHPTRGMISPVEFVPLLEDTGLILPVGAWVLETAAAQARAWLEQGIDCGRIAVNVSPKQFLDPEFPQLVADALSRSQLAPERLEIEITETLLMNDTESSAEMLRELKTMGVHVAIDDFGTGYSSLGRLKRFPIDTLKIDRTFTKEIGANADDDAICTTIIGLGHLLGMSVTAEGVETEDQQKFLEAHGCNSLQGYYLGKPMEASLFREWHERRFALPMASTG